LYAGLSEASVGTILRAHAVQPISAVEIEHSLWSRDFEDDVLLALRVENIKSIGVSRSATVPQIAVAWVLAKGLDLGNDIVPVVGTKQRKYLAENLAATEIQLTQAEIEMIEKAVPRGAAAGQRYPPPAMAALNG
jgi:aryl-alcohol dehydrogenase-like predicted oxidoreductase